MSAVQKQHDIVTTPAKVIKQLRKIANWKAPGPNGLQGFWLKSFTSCIERIALQLQDCLTTTQIPEWFTIGATTLILKDKEKGNIASNCTPITCLPLMWKLCTGIMVDERYNHLEEKRLLPEEQKGCRRKSRGTKDQLLIDKMVIRNCKRRQNGLGMAWVDYKKALDVIPHSWIMRCLQTFGAATNMTALLEKRMAQWRTELMAGEHALGIVNIRRGIFQGDSLSPLLFVVSLIPFSLVLRKMKVGYDVGNRKGLINHLLMPLNQWVTLTSVKYHDNLVTLMLLNHWLALTSVKYHDNLVTLMLLNQWLTPTSVKYHDNLVTFMLLNQWLALTSV